MRCGLEAALNHRVRRFLWVIAIAAAAGPAAAQRGPVLQQIKVRHPYYFRETFVPQVTSGPSAAAWSPDGTELVYSMQGSLWRQRVGDKTARQLTDGPGYDYQPDWSPDGRRIAFTSTAYEGRWHVFVVDLGDDGRAGTTRSTTPASGATSPTARCTPFWTSTPMPPQARST